MSSMRVIAGPPRWRGRSRRIASPRLMDAAVRVAAVDDSVHASSPAYISSSATSSGSPAPLPPARGRRRGWEPGSGGRIVRLGDGGVVRRSRGSWSVIGSWLCARRSRRQVGVLCRQCASSLRLAAPQRGGLGGLVGHLAPSSSGSSRHCRRASACSSQQTALPLSTCSGVTRKHTPAQCCGVAELLGVLRGA